MLSVVGGRESFSPAWASVALGLAAALVALDRFFGYSSGWMRYIKAEMHIRQVLEEFQMDWENSRVAWRGGTPKKEEIQAMIAQSKAKAEIKKTGGVNVEVTNGDQCDDGWQLTLDGGAPTPRSGKTAALTGLVPGPHRIKATGIIGGKPKQAEVSFTVPAGGIVAVPLLTLSRTDRLPVRLTPAPGAASPRRRGRGGCSGCS